MKFVPVLKTSGVTHNVSESCRFKMNAVQNTYMLNPKYLCIYEKMPYGHEPRTFKMLRDRKQIGPQCWVCLTHH